MRFLATHTVTLEVITDDGISAGTMTGELHSDTLRLNAVNIKPEYLSPVLLAQTLLEMLDAGRARGAKRVTWDYPEPAGTDYTDDKNDPHYRALLPFMIFRPELKLSRYHKGGEYYFDFSKLTGNMRHNKYYTPERFKSLGIEFLPVERLPEFYGQFEEILRSDYLAEGLSPLGREYVPEMSCIMLINGELAGWCLSTEISDEIARVSPVYIAKKFRAMKAGTMIEVHVMNLLMKKYSGIRLIYDKKQDAKLIRFYSFYLGKALTESARIFTIEIAVK